MTRSGVIPPRVHGILDYLLGIVLIVGPFVLGFDSDTAKTVSIVLGIGELGVAACTDWSTGVVKAIPPRVHGMIDYLLGVVLIASPFVFGFYDDDHTALGFFLVLGAGGLVLSLLTRFVPDEGTRHAEEYGDLSRGAPAR